MLGTRVGNSGKRPKNWKTGLGADTGMSAADNDVEFMLSSVSTAEFSSVDKLQLSHPNIVIADTGASINVTGNKIGLVNMCKAGNYSNLHLEKTTIFNYLRSYYKH